MRRLAWTLCPLKNASEASLNSISWRWFAVDESPSRNGALIFKSRVIDAYVEPYFPNVGPGAVYGNPKL